MLLFLNGQDLQSLILSKHTEVNVYMQMHHKISLHIYSMYLMDTVIQMYHTDVKSNRSIFKRKLYVYDFISGSILASLHCYVRNIPKSKHIFVPVYLLLMLFLPVRLYQHVLLYIPVLLFLRLSLYP